MLGHEMNYQQLLHSLTPDVYQNLKRAVELGRWPDGKLLSAEQRQTCMQAMIAYEHLHLPADQHSGFMPDQCASEDDAAKIIVDEPVKWTV